MNRRIIFQRGEEFGVLSVTDVLEISTGRVIGGLCASVCGQRPSVRRMYDDPGEAQASFAQDRQVSIDRDWQIIFEGRPLYG